MSHCVLSFGSLFHIFQRVFHRCYWFYFSNYVASNTLKINCFSLDDDIDEQGVESLADPLITSDSLITIQHFTNIITFPLRTIQTLHSYSQNYHKEFSIEAIIVSDQYLVSICHTKLSWIFMILYWTIPISKTWKISSRADAGQAHSVFRCVQVDEESEKYFLPLPSHLSLSPFFQFNGFDEDWKVIKE